MPAGYQVDFGQAAADYAQYRAGLPARVYDELAARGVGRPGQRVLDLGTGTGIFARGLAERGCTTFGADLRAPMLREARKLDAAAGVHVTYVQASTEQLPFGERSFDVITAANAWHWWEGKRMAADARRLLRNCGALVIASLDWMQLPDNLVSATEELILRHNPGWKLANTQSIGRRWLDQAAIAGFESIESFSFDLKLLYSHEGWRGRIRASAGVGASLAPEEVARFDAEHAELLRQRFPSEPLLVPHRVFCMVARD
jgi:2-polyprenyl-3-methyl-5-hydroxy-6-metoxy-1,4-benzoquinol methylase